jgi:hypothetical protein
MKLRMMGLSEKKIQNHVSFVVILAFFLLTSNALAEESLLGHYYNDAHQAFRQGNFLVSISGLEERLTGVGTDGEHGIEVAKRLLEG